MDLAKSFEEHISVRLRIASELMDDLKIDGLVFDAGTLQYYYGDDQALPFRPSHHFAHWCPLKGANHMVLVRRERVPELLFYQPVDFWYDHSPLGEPFWAPSFQIREFDSVEKIWDELKNLRGFAYVGPNEKRADEIGLSLDDRIEPYLNWYRCYKTDYEVQCIDRSSEIAARGHREAKDAFFEGDSELVIHSRYLNAVQATDFELPYTGIVAVNEKSAVLHYAEKRQAHGASQVLLIDSGANFNGYASDITRTYVSDECHKDFREMCHQMHQAQIKLCSMVKPGLEFAELHHASHLAVAEILLEHQVIKGLDAEQAYKEGLTRVFYPHGVGHMLGLLVHDVGGKQSNKNGDKIPVDENHPFLRSLRPIEEGFVFTIEPGLYFIESLLSKARSEAIGGYLNDRLIEELMPFGGIRVEDNVLVTADSSKNITRQYLA